MEPSQSQVVPIDINQEVKRSFMDYSMSVIVSRALPDVRDGLKPVHRRILYAMHDLGITSEKPHRKSAYVVGEVLGKYHPHGDTAVYDAMVRLAQDFSSRYPLIDGHGNFGSVDGDSAAAMRYTEVRMSRIALEMLEDIDKETVDFRMNYDDTREEPVVLPARFPNLLVNGSTGIAVGMATSIPPHNLGEVIDALFVLIADPEADAEQLMEAVKGPDFPTGGIIMGRKGISDAYRTGRGAIRVRARTSVEEGTGSKRAIVVSELPYMVNKARLLEKIADLVKEKRLEGISDLRDESDRSGMRMVIELRRDANPQVVLNQLFKHTQMEDTFGVILLALVDGTPRVLTIRQALLHYLDHRKQVITRRTRYELRKAQERLHIVEGLRIAIEQLDQVIQTIRQSRTTEQARRALMEGFELTEIQAQAILDLRLQKLTGLERQKLEEEYRQLLATIKRLEGILADDKKVLELVRRELVEIRERFGDNRRTEIREDEELLEAEDLIPETEVVITITNQGYIKRVPLETYRSQRRGGRGMTAITTKAEDVVEHLYVTTTHHFLLFFTNQGKMYRLKAYEVPESGRQAKGTSLVNLLSINGGEAVNAVIPVRVFSEQQNLVMATMKGVVKKTVLSQYRFGRRDGIIAINLDEGDELIGVRLTNGMEEILLATRQGQAIRFLEKEVRAMGRTAHGVKGIELAPEDRVVSVDIVDTQAELLVVTEQGSGKRTPIAEFRPHHRGGKGVIAIKSKEEQVSLVAVKLVRPEDEIMIITGEGVAIRQPVAGISVQGRNTQGVKLMALDEGDKVVAVAKIDSREEEE